MRIRYQIERSETAEGVVDLGLDLAAEWLASSPQERRDIVAPLARDDADRADAWMSAETVRHLVDDPEPVDARWW